MSDSAEIGFSTLEAANAGDRPLAARVIATTISIIVGVARRIARRSRLHDPRRPRARTDISATRRTGSAERDGRHARSDAASTRQPPPQPKRCRPGGRSSGIKVWRWLATSPTPSRGRVKLSQPQQRPRRLHRHRQEGRVARGERLDLVDFRLRHHVALQLDRDRLVVGALDVGLRHAPKPLRRQLERRCQTAPAAAASASPSRLPPRSAPRRGRKAP